MAQLDGFFVFQIFMTPVRLSKSILVKHVGDGHPISQEAHPASSCAEAENNHWALDEDDDLHVRAVLYGN